MSSPMSSRVVTLTSYKNKIFASIEVHIGCISICCAYEKPSKNNLTKDALNGMAYYIFLKSLRSLEDFKKIFISKFLLNLLVQIFNALVYSKIQFLFRNRTFHQISAQSAQPPANLFSLSGHAAHPAFLPPSPHRPSASSSSSRAVTPWTPPPPSPVEWSPLTVAPPPSIGHSYPLLHSQ
jgi:hypothetical protein